MITPEDFEWIDKTIDNVNLKKLEDLSPETRASIERGIQQAKEGKLTTRSFTDIELEEDFTPEQINIGSKVVMTHQERQEWWRSSGLLERLGIDMGDDTFSD